MRRVLLIVYLVVYLLPGLSGASSFDAGGSGGGGGSGTVTASGPPVAGQAAEWTSATDITGVAISGTGSYVKATSPTLVTPALGTPSSGVATNLTSLPAAQVTGAAALPDSVLSANVPLLNAANTYTLSPQTISNTAPSLVFTDTTASAKSLTVAVDANLAQLRESAGSSGSSMVLDLTNNRLGIGTTTIPYKLVLQAASGLDGLSIRNTGNAGGDFAFFEFMQAGSQKGVVYSNSENMTLNAATGRMIFNGLTHVAVLTGLNISAGGTVTPPTNGLLVGGTTDATSPTTGAIIASGGMGLAKSLYVGGSIGHRDTTAAFDVIETFTSSATLTANRTLTIGVGNVDHTILYGTTANTITFPSVASDTVVMLGATQTLVGKTLTTPTVNGGTHTAIAGLGIRDTSAAFDVTIAATDPSTISAGRTLTLGMGNVAHTLAFGTTANTITFPSVASDTVGMLAAVQTLTNKRITSRIVTLTDAATVTPNADTTDVGLLATLSQATQIANPTGTPTDGQRLALRIKSTTARALTYGSQFRGGTDVALLASTTGSSKTDYLGFFWNAADSTWDFAAVTRGY